MYTYYNKDEYTTYYLLYCDTAAFFVTTYGYYGFYCDSTVTVLLKPTVIGDWEWYDTYGVAAYVYKGGCTVELL